MCCCCLIDKHLFHWMDLRLLESDRFFCSCVLYVAHFIYSSSSVFQNIQMLRSQTLHPYKIHFLLSVIYQIYNSVVWVLSGVNIYHCGEPSFLLRNTLSHGSHAVIQQRLAPIHSIPWAAGYIFFRTGATCLRYNAMKRWKTGNPLAVKTPGLKKPVHFMCFLTLCLVNLYL